MLVKNVTRLKEGIAKNVFKLDHYVVIFKSGLWLVSQEPVNTDMVVFCETVESLSTNEKVKKNPGEGFLKYTMKCVTKNLESLQSRHISQEQIRSYLQGYFSSDMQVFKMIRAAVVFNKRHKGEGKRAYIVRLQKIINERRTLCL